MARANTKKKPAEKVGWQCSEEEAQRAMAVPWWNLGQLLLWAGLRDPESVAFASDDGGTLGKGKGNLVACVIAEWRWQGKTAEQQERWRRAAFDALRSMQIMTIGTLPGSHVPIEIPEIEWPSLDLNWDLREGANLVRIDSRSTPLYIAYEAVKVKRADALKVFPAPDAQPQPETVSSAPKKKGRGKGVGSLNTQDLPFVLETRKLCETGAAASPHAALQSIAKAQELPGTGTMDSRIDRLLRRYRTTYPD